MSNDYVENDNGFFVKATLFKDDINGRQWRTPFTEEFYKGISRSFGKIPYIDYTGLTYDEHGEFNNDKMVNELQAKGIPDTEIINKLHEKYANGAVGYVVDMYDVQKKTKYGNVLNTCALSMGMCEKSDPEVAVLDFLIKIEDEAYKQAIRDGKVKITPSPSLYGGYIEQNGVEVLNTADFFDMIHVANATIPANGKEAQMKAFCEGTHGECKKKMLYAALPIENINNSVTQDTNRMSETPQPNATPAVAEPTVPANTGFNTEEFTKLLDNYNVPKEVIGKLEALNTTVSELQKANESNKTELEGFKQREQERKIQERKNLISKHITLDHFGGKTEDFTKKVEWINNTFKTDDDLSVYLNEAFPIKAPEAAPKAKEDKPEPKSVYGSIQFDPNELLKTEATKEGDVPTSKKVRISTWGSILPLSIRETI